MKKCLFNDGWMVKSGIAGPFDALFGGSDAGKPVCLPHDAMIEEERNPASISGTQYGFYPAKSYTYTKTFMAPESWAGLQTLLEFEGVQQNALVYLNGNHIASSGNGYLPFFADLTPYLVYGQENQLKVLVSSREQASRWYPGAGIYRDVWLWQQGDIAFGINTQRITTVSVEPEYAVIRVEGEIRNDGRNARKLNIQILTENAQENLQIAVGGRDCTHWAVNLAVDNPRLWSDVHPNLYKMELAVLDGGNELDRWESAFGIRTLFMDARKGFRVNGVPTELRGACIHHDNGILGAVSMYDAELHRMKLLKAAGFNAIRSAHNPASPALLRACDEVGIFVMDELSDMWNEPKNAQDGAFSFADSWETQVSGLVNKDYNHPSVVLYSIGNEIPEIGRFSGAAMASRITAKLRKLDSSRFTTMGLNGFLAVADDMHLFAAAAAQSASSGGSEELNSMMGGTQQQMMDAFAVSDLLTNRIEAANSTVDVAGFNYLTMRHAFEHTLHPTRVVVGSETYPPEIARLWRVVKENPHVIGDFTWTGLDYIGEAGIGIYHYRPEKAVQGWFPDRLAYCGDIDLNGTRRPVSYLREIAYGLRKDPLIAVERPDKYGIPYDENNWKYPDCIDSWTFPGWEGKPARIRVLADCDEVELLVNDVSLGRKQPEELTAVFETIYTPGKLTAIAYQNGAVWAETTLETAGETAALQVACDKEILCADGQSIAFLTADLVDAEGRRNRWEQKEITVTVEGAAVLAGFGSAIPSGGGSYQDASWETFDGRVMAAIRSTLENGNIRVYFSAPGCETVAVELMSVNR